MEPLSHHVEELRKEPTSEAAAARVRKEARAQGDLRAYVEAFMARGTQLAARNLSDSAAVAYLEAAMVAEEIQDWMLAADLFRLAYLSDPRKRDPLVLLGRALTRAGKPRELVPILRDMLRGSTEPAARAELHLQLADFLATELRDSAAAVEEIRAALKSDPDNPASSARAREMLTAHGLSQAFEQLEGRPSQGVPRPPAGPPPARASVNPPPPVRASVNPPAPVRVSGSGPITPVGSLPVSPQAARFRASLAPQTPAPRPPAASAPAAPRPELDETRAAITALTGALRASPSDLGLIDELMRLGQLVEDPSLVIQAYEEAVRASSDPSLRSYIRTRLGTLYNRSLERPEEAVRVFAAILDDDPRNPEARRMLVAREGPDVASDGMTPEQEGLLIAGLAKESAQGMPPPAVVPPKLLEPLPKVDLPPLKYSIAPTPLPYSQPAPPPPSPGLGAPQRAVLVALVLFAALGAYLTLTDALWPELAVGSRPHGATIVIDGEARAETTPAMIRIAPNQPHLVELRFAGAAPKVVASAITLGYRTQSSTTAVLEALPRVARVTPVAAKVEMNSREVGVGTSVTLSDFALDEPVHLRFTAEGHIPAQRSFEFGHLMPEVVEIVLTPIPAR